MWKKQGWILENSKTQTILGSGKWDGKKKTQKGKPSFKEENKCIPATYTYLDTSIMKV